MGISYNPEVVVGGLVELLEPNLADGTTTQSIKSKVSSSNFTAYNYSVGTSATFKTFQSNVLSDGSGTSYVAVPRNSQLETGSITFIIWMNLENVPIDVGANNNWRGLLSTSSFGTSGSPLTMVLEEGNYVNFTTTHTDLYRRHLDGSFTPVLLNSTGWQMLTYTYDSSTGNAAVYKNNLLIRSGPMTNGNSGVSPTTSGTQLTYSNYTGSGFQIYGGTSTGANPNGNGFVPGELGHVFIYNRALTQNEIDANFTALRRRYGI
jgi:hypothetical protein